MSKKATYHTVAFSFMDKVKSEARILSVDAEPI
jgi:hypothetical protein